MHAMVYLASNTGRLVPTAEITERLQVSGAHLSKVMQRLSKGGLVKSIRGPKGGFQPGRVPSEITLLDVFECIEGPFEPTDCLLDVPTCNGGCLFEGLLQSINDQMKTYLTKTRISALKHLYGKKK